MTKSIIVIAILATVISCGRVDPNSTVDEGKVEGNFYTSDEVGWTVEIPAGWSIVDKTSKDETTQKGLQALEETMGTEIDYSGLKELIGFQKNQFNIFQSTSEPFETKHPGEWEENNAALKQIIYTTYVDQGIKVDSSATTIEKIDGLDFHTYSFTIYSPKGEVILEQKMFGRLINGLDFGVNINYNNDADRDDMLRVFRQSQFKRD